MTKSLSCEVIVSEEVRNTAGVPPDALPQHDVDIRGRAEPMVVRAAVSAKSLSALVGEPRPPRHNATSPRNTTETSDETLRVSAHI